MVTARTRAPSWFTATTGLPVWSRSWSIGAAIASGISPKPSRGYRKLSTRLSASWAFRLSMFLTASRKDNPRMRCAAKSASILSQGTPQTFSL